MGQIIFLWHKKTLVPIRYKAHLSDWFRKCYNFGPGTRWILLELMPGLDGCIRMDPEILAL